MIAPVSTSLAFPYIICLGQSMCKAVGPTLFYDCFFSSGVVHRARLRVKTAAFGAKKLPRLFTALYGFWAFPKWCYGRRSSSRFKSYEVSKFRLALGRKIK
ncbi:hypothetical protein YC2023_051346 [Brassica napus]